MHRRIACKVRVAVNAAGRRLGDLGVVMRRVWVAHRDLLRSNPAYAAAVVAGAAAIAGQPDFVDLMAAAAATVLAVYAALRKVIARP